MPMAAYTANVTAFAPENCCDLKIPSGTIGFAMRASTSRNAARATTPSTPRPTEVAVQPWPGPSISAYTTPASPTVSSTLPTTSRCAPACSSRDSGTWRSAIRIAAAEIGRLMTNTHRHDTESMR